MISTGFAEDEESKMGQQAKWLNAVAVLFLIAGVALLFSGCGEDETGDTEPEGTEEFVGEESPTVGGTCTDNEDCQEKCLTGGDWPGGMCTVSCSDDRDCPDLSYCIEEERGVCLMDCMEDDDCPSGYECEDEDREGHRGKAYVCVGD